MAGTGLLGPGRGLALVVQIRTRPRVCTTVRLRLRLRLRGAGRPLGRSLARLGGCCLALLVLLRSWGLAWPGSGLACARLPLQADMGASMPDDRGALHGRGAAPDYAAACTVSSCNTSDMQSCTSSGLPAWLTLGLLAGSEGMSTKRSSSSAPEPDSREGLRGRLPRRGSGRLALLALGVPLHSSRDYWWPAGGPW